MGSPPAQPTAGGSWLSATIEARERALEAAAPDARASAVVRLARAMAWSGAVGAASQRIVSERRLQRKRGVKSEIARCELGLAEIALLEDDEDRAAVHLDAATDVSPEDLAVRQLLGDWIGARRGSPEAFSEIPPATQGGISPWSIELFDAVALELLWSSEEATLEVRGTDVRTRALREVWLATRADDAKKLQAALGTLETSGLARDFGRSLLRVLATDAALLAPEPSHWIERAKIALGEASTWRDRVALRHAERLHGTQAMLPREVASRLDARDRMHAHVRSTLAIGLERQSRALDDLETALSAAERRAPERATLAAVTSLRDATDLLDAAMSASLSELGREEGELAQLVTSNSAAAARGRDLSATVDAMPDGLLAIDARSVVTAVNESAARTLHLEAARMLGRRLDDIEGLAPLAAALAQTERPEGTVVRLPHGALLVSAREGPQQSVVATIVEYERALRIAHKLVGSRARYTFADLRGSDPALREAIDVARRAALVDANLLIVGEIGTGKGLLAQAIHAAGPRAREPFVTIDCTKAGQDSDLLAEEGTVLLDQVVELSPEAQSRLLDRLQERVVGRGPSPAGQLSRARVIATARHDPSLEVERGTFLPELYKRLRTLQIVLPPLRERPGDIPVLAQHFVRRIGERQGKAVRTISKEVESALLAHTWAGNVRELVEAIEKEVSTLAPDQRVLERVPASIVRMSTAPGSPSMPPAALSILPLAEVERAAYLDAYERCNRSVTKAARALGVSKVTFYGKLRLFGMHPAETTGDLPAMKNAAKILAQEAVDQAREEAQPTSKRGPREPR